MTARTIQDDLLAGLQRIAAHPKAGTRQQKMAKGVLQRLQAPVSICVTGTDKSARSDVMGGLVGLSHHPDIRLWQMPADEADFDGIDIAIWCSAAFNHEDERLWGDAPETLKDRSILLLTATPDPHRHMAHSFDDVVAAPKADRTASLADLAKRLQARVRAGRQADADTAAMLIETCKLPGAPTCQKAPLPIAPAPDAKSPILSQIEALMRDHAVGLQNAQQNPETCAAHVLSSCQDLCQTILDRVDDTSQSPDLGPIWDDMQDAHDSIVLMALEGGEAAAADAIATLIQLRKELQLELAA